MDGNESQHAGLRNCDQFCKSKSNLLHPLPFQISCWNFNGHNTSIKKN